MAYVEIYVLPVKTDQLDEYRKIAVEAAELWLLLRALSVTEAVAENAPYGTLTSFPRAVILDSEETVVMACLTFRDRAHRNAAMIQTEKVPRMIELFETAPIDVDRMIWGGFEVFVDLKAAA